jgi:glycerol-3-phosphate dehydrogenase
MDAPILSQIHAILFDGKEPLSAIQALMGRGLKAE